MNDSLELAYLAGFFDGEGCVTIAGPDDKQRQALQIVVANTEPDVLRLFQARWGGTMALRPSRNERHKRLWDWKLCSQNAVVALNELLPHLHLKGSRAEIAIRFQALKSGENNMQHLSGPHPRRQEILDARMECYEALRVLNKRGC